MSVTRINEFRAIDGRQDELRLALTNLLPSIRASEGCLSVHLLQSESDPTRVVVVEVWRDHSTHQAAARAIPQTSLHKVMPLLATLPLGGYYSEYS